MRVSTFLRRVSMPSVAWGGGGKRVHHGVRAPPGDKGGSLKGTTGVQKALQAENQEYWAWPSTDKVCLAVDPHPTPPINENHKNSPRSSPARPGAAPQR